MRSQKPVSVLLCLVFFVFVGSGRADDISGTISATRTILNDSQLTGNVTCTVTDGPCVLFGAPNIKLSLNGFTLTGPSNPDDSSTCNPTSGAPAADLVSTNNQTNVQILGPGLLQNSRRHGIFMNGTAGTSTRITVKNVTSSHNCFSGLLMTAVSDSIMEGNVSVRNSLNSGAAPCGGNCLVSSNNNHIWKNQFSGNGSVCPTASCTNAAVTVASNNDFGVGLVGTSSGNLIESNSLSGNTNGVLIQAGAAGNVIRQNVIAGNPPSQLTRDYGPVGFDVKDESTTNGERNSFQGNQCVTYSGPAPAVCPNLPAGDVTTILAPPANRPTATAISFSAATVTVGGSFTATFTGSNISANTVFDVRFRVPGSTTDAVALNWQQGASAIHTAPVGTQAGVYTATGIRAHSSTTDAAGPFIPVSITLTVQ